MGKQNHIDHLHELVADHFVIILEELLAPHSLQDFCETHLSREPYAAPFKAARFKNLINWELIESILTSKYDNCWLAQQGHLPDQKELSTGQLTPEQARENFKKGRTVLVRHAEKAHPVLEDIAQDFSRLFQAPIDIQLYCTPAGQEGFNWHYDLEEVFVIQTSGEKEFYLRKNTLSPRPRFMPKDLEFEKETNRTEIRCLLKEGDWLYIPSGFWHKAKAITDSFHMSVGVMPTWRL